MQFQKKLIKKVGTKDLCALKVSVIWKGFWQEHTSFWFLCAYYFFEYVRPQSLYPAIDFFPWSTFFLGLTLISSFTNKSISWVINPMNKLMVLFCILVVISGVFAFNPEASWGYKETMLGWFIVYFLTINLINTEKKLILFLIFYLLYSLKMAQFGAITWIGRGFSFADYGLTGTPGWFHNSGEYAIQMIIYGSLSLAFVVSLSEYWGKAKKIILYISATFGYLAVIGSSSRGSQLALGVIIVLFFLKQKNGFKGLVLISVLSAALFFILPEEQMNRFGQAGDDNSSMQRFAYWEAGIEIIKENPVFGIGYNNWIYYMLDKYPNGVGPYMLIQQPHNIFVQVSSELGITGLLCFLLLVTYAFINNSRTRKIALILENKFIFNMSYGLDAGLIGYLVAGFFVTVLYYPFFWIQITMIVMLNAVAMKQYKKLLDKHLTHL
jgi:putative inorganic carbon (HCO3(-)) transporter